jgi:hypothetical protein
MNYAAENVPQLIRAVKILCGSGACSLVELYDDIVYIFSTTTSKIGG